MLLSFSYRSLGESTAGPVGQFSGLFSFPSKYQKEKSRDDLPLRRVIRNQAVPAPCKRKTPDERVELRIVTEVDPARMTTCRFAKMKEETF